MKKWKKAIFTKETLYQINEYFSHNLLTLLESQEQQLYT